MKDEYVEVDMTLLKKYHKADWSISSMAEAFGVNQETLHTWIKRMYLTGELIPRDKGHKPKNDVRSIRRREREKEVLRMRKMNRSVAEMAIALGISEVGVSKIIASLIAEGRLERLTPAEVVERDKK
jgi:transposase-like protein